MTRRDDAEKTGVHVNLNEYQLAYLKEEGYNVSKVIRDELDSRMERDGADPEEWAEVYDDG